MIQKVKIEVPNSVFETKVLNERGEPLHPKIKSIRFEHNVGEAPRLFLEVYAMETVIEGEIDVERIAICPACKKELANEIVCTSAHDQEYETFQIIREATS